MRYIAYICCLVVLACGNAEKNPASTVLTEEEMVHIMTDIHLLEGARIADRVMGDTVKLSHYYEKLYGKYELTEEAFKESFRYYTEHPKEFDRIYEKVIEALNELESLNKVKVYDPPKPASPDKKQQEKLPPAQKE